MPRKTLEVQRSLLDCMSPTNETLDSIKAHWSSCTKCNRLCQGRTQVVFWDKVPNTSPKVMVVGQWPGKDEDKTGIPFKGKLGVLSRQIVMGQTIPSSDIHWTNVLGCRIPEDFSFSSKYADNCWDRLEAEIRIVKPKILVALGRVSMSRLSGARTIKVHEVAGTVGRYKGIPVVFLTHPAKIMRIDGKKEQAEARASIEQEAQVLHGLYRELNSPRPNPNTNPTPPRSTS